VTTSATSDAILTIGNDNSSAYVAASFQDGPNASLGLTKIGTGMPGMFALVSETAPATLQAWMAKEFLSGNAAVLPKRFDDARFAFYNQTLLGTPEQRPRWKRAIGETEGLIGELVGKAYVARFFPAENKAAMPQSVASVYVCFVAGIIAIPAQQRLPLRRAEPRRDSFRVTHRAPPPGSRLAWRGNTHQGRFRRQIAHC
jgi:putative endopeptidase